MIKELNGDRCHEMLASEIKGKLAYSDNCNYSEWKLKIRAKLNELLKLDVIAQNDCELNIEFEETVEFDTYTRIRFTYDSEKGNTVPAYLLIPKLGKDKYPLAIALQGHSTGFHNSIGVVKYDRDVEFQERDCFGLQAVENGFVTLCIEQRGMGEVRSPRYPVIGKSHPCSFTAMTALNLGRTIIGERVWDIKKGIDTMEKLAYPFVDLDKIMVFGTSGGGTATFYAACCDARIKYAAVSCAFCSYKASIMDIVHCVCNYIPEASVWFEMGDLSCLVAPAKLTVLAGLHDKIFPIDGVRESYATVEKIYAREGTPDNCRLVIMPKDHYWCKDVAWQAINEDVKKLGW